MIRLIQTRLDELRRDEKGIDEWMEFRDLALIGVMIGGGLKVSHIGALTLSCIDLTEERIDLSKPGFAHRARLLPFAVAALKAWLDVQRDLHAGKLSPTQKIFEADRKSGFGRTSKTVTLSASSIHRRTNALLKLRGLPGTGRAPRPFAIPTPVSSLRAGRPTSTWLITSACRPR